MTSNKGQGDPDEGEDAAHTWSFTIADLHPVKTPRRRSITFPLPSPKTQESRFSGGQGTGDPLFANEDDNTTDIRKVVGESEADRALRFKAAAEAREGVQAAIGQTVANRYRIEESIAVGGMGRVYRVKHLHLDKRFALKQMHVNLNSDEKARAGFLQEARLASGLSHANIVSVVDFGEDPELGVFMVMELVEGEPLSRRLRKKERLPLRMACEVILQIADALHYIHKEGIVHGDIKPDNILLCRAGRSELRRWKVCLLDFGLARPKLATDNDKELVAGTPPYMAPEVICGDALAEPADIYSLGILSYQLVTGKTPFQGGMRELMIQHMQEPPKPMSQRIGEEVDERLEALVMKALQKKATDRQSSMAAFLFEMKTLMDMLGFGTRRRKKRSVIAPTENETPEHRLSKMAFEQCGFGIAVVESNGRVAVANKAFAHFFRAGKSESTVRLTVLDPRFLRIHPELPSDLEQIASTGQGIRRLLSFNDVQGNGIEMIFNLAPLKGAEGKLVLSIIPIG